MNFKNIKFSDIKAFKYNNETIVLKIDECILLCLWKIKTDTGMVYYKNDIFSCIFFKLSDAKKYVYNKIKNEEYEFIKNFENLATSQG